MASLVIGFAISAIFSALFAPEQKGPRLDNLKLQNSQYGDMIRIIYGTARIPGNVVWQTDLTEHTHTSGGKGGPKVTTYTYSASFAVKLNKRKPGDAAAMIEVRRMWADKQLVWSADDPKTGNVPFKTYVGQESDLPDPTMESVLGVGNVPAFRDDGAVVVTDWDLSPFGNRIPNLEFEVVTNAGMRPARISTYDRLNVGSDSGGISRDPDTGKLTNSWFNWSPGQISPITLTTQVTDINGVVASTDTADIETVDDAHVFTMTAALNDPSLWYQGVVGPDNGFFKDGALVAQPVLGGRVTDVYTQMYYYQDNLYVLGGDNVPYLARIPAPNGFPSNGLDAVYALPSSIASQNYEMTVSNDGFIYVADGTIGRHFFAKFDTDLNLVRDWGTNGPDVGAFSFMVYDDLILHWGTDLGGHPVAVLEQMNDDDSLTFIGEIPIANGDLIPLGGGLCSVADGVVTIFPPPEPVTLASVVASISAWCDNAAYNVDQLTQLVDCYVVDTQMPGADMITPLRQGYYFDAVEQDNEVVFVNRGAPPAITIPIDDLACVAKGGTPPALLQTTRTTDDRKIPAIIYGKYINLGADYQQGTQQDQRVVTQSQEVETLDLSIGFNDMRAKQVCTVRLYEYWIRRDSPFVFYLPRKYDVWMPTDVVAVDDGVCVRTIQITDRDWMPSAVIKFEGVATAQQIYYQATPGGDAAGFRTPAPPAVAQSTQLVLLDIPLVTDADSANGLYAAMAGASTDNWLGGALYKSPDGAATFTQIAQTQSADVIGRTTTALGAFGGGDMFDEGNSVTVQIGNGGGTLSSFTQANVLGGAGMYLVGNEIIAAKNATLNGDGTVTFTGMLRGQRGTEWAEIGHVVGEIFIALPVSTNPSALFGEIGQPLDYEAITLAQSLATGNVQVFTNTGNALKCYSPVQLGGGTDGSGNVALNWSRRTRIGARMAAPADVPLSEPSEEYIVQIMDSTYTNTARIIHPIGFSGALYLGADQTSDFGAHQKTIFFSVGQIGSEGLGQLAYGTAGGAGSTNDAVLVPIPPYGSPPPATGSCPLPTTNSTLPWVNNATIHSAYLTPDGYWLITFTTGASVPGLGTITMAEFGGGPIQRNAVLSTSPCGNPLTPSCAVNNARATFPFYMQGNPGGYYPTLAASTTYMIAVLTSSPGAMYCQLQLPH